MSIATGNIQSNFRYNPVTGLLVPAEITAEQQTVAEFTTEFSGYYGFTLNETPQTDIEGITEVKRVSDSQVFTRTTSPIIGLAEYFFDYLNDMPTLFFNSAANGVLFTVKYYGVGGAVNAKNITAIVDDSVSGLDSRITTNENDIAAIETELSDMAGMIIGGIEFNTTILPPKILSGTYDISENKVKLTSDSSLALADVFQQSKNTLDTFVHYLVCMDSAGDKKYVMCGEGTVSSGTITSITSSGTTYTLTVASGTVAVNTNKVLVIEGNDNINGVFKITGGNGTTTYTFTTQSGFTNGGSSGTWRVLERIQTKHGTGTLAAITTDASVIKYSPSLGENGSTSIAAFDQTKNGFYLTLSGLTDYRVLGSFFTDTTPDVSATVFSYKSGRDKNDNYFNFLGIASKVTNAVRLADSSSNVLFGCDYVYTDTAGAGSEFVPNRDLWTTSTFVGTSSSGSWQIEIAIISVSSNVILNTRGGTALYVDYNIGVNAAGTMPLRKISKGLILKPFASTSVLNTSAEVRFMGSFTI